MEAQLDGAVGSLQSLSTPRIARANGAGEQTLVRCPDILNAAVISHMLGGDFQVRTIDVATGHPGPTMPLQHFQQYMEQRAAVAEQADNDREDGSQSESPASDETLDSSMATGSAGQFHGRGQATHVSSFGKASRVPDKWLRRALMVHSLPIANTPLAQQLMIHPTLLKSSISYHLASSGALSPSEAQQLHQCLGPAGPPEPPRLSPYGAVRWFFINSGRIKLHLFPGTDVNMSLYQKGSGGKPASVSKFKDRMLLTCSPGDVVAVPAGWLLSREILEPAVTTSGLCLCVEQLPLHLKCVDIELHHTPQCPYAPPHSPNLLLQSLWALASHANQHLRTAADMPAFESHSQTPRHPSGAVAAGAGATVEGEAEVCLPDAEHCTRESNRAPGAAAASPPQRRKAKPCDDFIAESDDSAEPSKSEDDFKASSDEGEGGIAGSPSAAASKSDPSFEVIGDEDASPPVRAKAAARAKSPARPRAPDAPTGRKRQKVVKLKRSSEQVPRGGDERQGRDRKERSHRQRDDAPLRLLAEEMDLEALGVDVAAIQTGKRRRVARWDPQSMLSVGEEGVERGQGAARERSTRLPAATPAPHIQTGVATGSREAPPPRIKPSTGRGDISSDDDFNDDFGTDSVRPSRTVPTTRTKRPRNTSDEFIDDDAECWEQEGADAAASEEEKDDWVSDDMSDACLEDYAAAAAPAPARRSRRAAAGSHLQAAVAAELAEEVAEAPDDGAVVPRPRIRIKKSVKAVAPAPASAAPAATARPGDAPRKLKLRVRSSGRGQGHARNASNPHMPPDAPG